MSEQTPDSCGARLGAVEQRLSRLESQMDATTREVASMRGDVGRMIDVLQGQGRRTERCMELMGEGARNLLGIMEPTRLRWIAVIAAVIAGPEYVSVVLDALPSISVGAGAAEMEMAPGESIDTDGTL
jgi:hypothetical protein